MADVGCEAIALARVGAFAAPSGAAERDYLVRKRVGQPLRPLRDHANGLGTRAPFAYAPSSRSRNSARPFHALGGSPRRAILHLQEGQGLRSLEVGRMGRGQVEQPVLASNPRGAPTRSGNEGFPSTRDPWRWSCVRIARRRHRVPRRGVQVATGRMLRCWSGATRLLPCPRWLSVTRGPRAHRLYTNATADE